MPPPAAASGRRDPDVLVIGGGIVGLFCAYFLRRAGNSVALVERGPVGGPLSCSAGNTGFVGTQGSVPLAEPSVAAQGLRSLLNPDSPFHIHPRWDPGLASWLWHFRRACTPEAASAGFGVLHDLKKHSLDILRTLCASGPLADTVTTTGILLACRTEQGFDRACRSVPQAIAHGVPLRVLAPDDLAKLEPDAEYDICGALYNEEGAALHTPAFLTGLVRLLTTMGVEVRPFTDVLGFDVADRRVRQVRTNAGDFAPGETVVAAGIWSRDTARTLGVRLALQPAKGYTVTVGAPARAPRLPVLLTEGKLALLPLGDRLRISGVLELAGTGTAVPSRQVDGILRTARSYLPDLAGMATLDTWSGLRPCTPDGLPLLGRLGGYRNVCVATGGGHVGMGLGPAMGQLIAQVVAGTEPDTPLGPLNPGRYQGWSRRSGHASGWAGLPR